MQANTGEKRRWGREMIGLSAFLMVTYIVRVALESRGISLFTLPPAMEAMLLVATVASFITACIRLE